MKTQIIDAFFEGQCINAYEYFGAHLGFQQEEGVHFRTFAPHAQSIQVIGSFNDWSFEGCYMKKIDDRGVWEVFVPKVNAGDLYRYRIKTQQGVCVDKIDPYGFYSELRPNRANVVANLDYEWQDDTWLENRTRCFQEPLNIYEVHLGAWKIDLGHDETEVDYRKIAKPLIQYVKKMNYTHIELMPLCEHPFDGSWGYQVSGYFCVTPRYGSIEDLKYLVNECHKNQIGVIFDFVPVHFVSDEYALSCYDGSAVYEYQDPKQARSEWGTHNFDLGRESVRSFLMSSAAYWIKEIHGDGLRMDAVSNIIYWQGNKFNGVNENALAFMRRMNFMMHTNFHEVIMIAEDSSDFSAVTKPTIEGGLGFDYKWDLGWMNDTLEYFKMDPIYRKHHHNKINFSMAYFYSEKFILPFSHDEVVHGKATIVNKMWGLYEQKFAQARMLFTYMVMHPGKKLNFMGNEIGQMREFDEKEENDWFLLKYPIHDSFHNYIKKLNQLYTKEKTLYENEYDYLSFEWIDADNADENLYSFIRKGSEYDYVVILNASNVVYEKHRFGVNDEGSYKEILNSDKDIYAGSHVVNPRAIKAKAMKWDHKPYCIEVNVGAFAGIILKHKKTDTGEEK